MSKLFLFLIFSFFTTNSIAQSQISFRNQKYHHQPRTIDVTDVVKLANLSNRTHMNEVLDNICIERIVGTPGHKKVRDYIKTSLKNLGWKIEVDAFNDDTPNFGRLRFRNIIAKLNPNAHRFLTLACHYDSKFIKNEVFIGATDSAVPCAQLLNTAKVMDKQLKSIKHHNVSLMLIFFDGEEAFEHWGPKDSIYGARHLARSWERKPYSLRDSVNDISELDRIDLLVLLDLIGAPDPKFYNYFTDTQRWFELFSSAEDILAELMLFNNYSYDEVQQRYFQMFSTPSFIEDDHVPFLQRDVPVVHLITYPFPDFWHKSDDKRENVDLITTENISKILRLFIASYLHIYQI